MRTAGSRWRDGRFETARLVHTATRLNDGEVLIAGGENHRGGADLEPAELFDPKTREWEIAEFAEAFKKGRATGRVVMSSEAGVAPLWLRAYARGQSASDCRIGTRAVIVLASG